LISALSQETQIQWSQFWTENWATFFNYKTSTIPFHKPVSGLINNSNPRKSALGFGLNYKLLQKMNLSAELGVQEDLYVNSSSPGTVTLETHPSPFLSASLSRELFKVRSLQLDGKLGINLTPRTSFDTLDSYGSSKYLTMIQISQTFRHFTFFANGQYSSNKTKTSLCEQTEQEFGATLGFFVPLSDDSEKETP
jgi:hypothetical protein